MSKLTSNMVSEKNKKGLYTQTLGNGKETLVFLAGLGGTTRYWEARMEPLKNNYRIVLVDLFGFGRSPMPITTYTLDRHIEYLEKALSHLPSFTMIGHSLGALLTVAYTARHPEQVKNIAIISLPYFESKEVAFEYMRHGPVKGGFLYTNKFLAMMTCMFSRRVFGWTIPRFAQDIPSEVLEDLVKHNMFSSISSLWEVVYNYDVYVDLQRLSEDKIILFIHGDKDLTAPLNSIEKIAANHPHWQLQVLIGQDHHPFLHDTERCLQLINILAKSA